MSTTYNYRKFQGIENISRSQAEALGNYKKATFINGEISLIEVFINGKLNRMSFYIDDSQTFEQKRQSVMAAYPVLKNFSVRRKEVEGNYLKEYVIDYKAYGIGSSQPSLYVYDENGNNIGIQNVIEIHTGALSHNDTVKSFYSKQVWKEWCEPNLEVGVNDPTFHVFDAFYNNDGTLRIIDFNSMSTYDKEYFDPNSNTQEHSLDLLWHKSGFNQEQINYFLSSNLLPIPVGLY